MGHIFLEEKSSPWLTGRLQADSEVAKHQLVGVAGPTRHTSELAEFLTPSHSHVSAELRERLSVFLGTSSGAACVKAQFLLKVVLLFCRFQGTH